MKYTITINQSAVFSNGMINKTDLVDWAIIDYLKDFAIYRNARKIVYQDEEYIWLNYNHLINSLPLAHFRVKSAISYRINKLRGLGLIKTIRNTDNTLYYTFTDKLIDICFCKSSDIARLRAKNVDPVKLNARDPVQIGITGGVQIGITAQYKTKNTIINKDNNRNNFFISSSLKPKNGKSQINTDEHRLELNTKYVGQGFSLAKPERNPKGSPYNTNSAVSASSAVKNIKGFTTMSGSVWKILADIKERQKISSMKNKQITRSNL